MTTLKKLMSLHGRCAVITGGAGHIAVSMANTLAELGADLILVDRNMESLTVLQKNLINQWGVKVDVHLCNLEEEPERDRLIEDLKEQHEAIDVLINNAAFVGTTELEGWVTKFEHQSLTTWRRAFEVNLTAPFHLSQALSPLLQKNKRGSIINIGSIYGEYGPVWSMYEGTIMGSPAAYGASKGGLFQFTRWLATTIAPDVRVNAISPGGVARGQPERFVEKYIARTPMGRMATEDDFCGAVALLASDASKYITGQIISIDGGWGAW